MDWSTVPPAIREIEGDHPGRRLSPCRTVAAYLALLASLVGVFFAVVAWGLLCDENCSGRSWELNVQLGLAVAGFVLTVGMLNAAVKGARATIGWLIAAILTFAVWAVILDAATHGWGNGPVPF